MHTRRPSPLKYAAAVFFLGAALAGCGRPSELRVFFNSAFPVSSYDPGRAYYAQDYLFLENVYSPLVEYSSGDELVSGAAASFGWAGGEAVFGMRPGLKTADGRPIDAYDAELSLKRAFIIGGPEQDLLKGLVCGPAPLKKLSDACPGLSVRDGGRTLAMKLPERKPFLFHLLANIPFAVLPRGSFDPATLKITDYRNTSGPYFVASEEPGGFWRLRANPFHYRYSPDMPQTVAAVPLTRYISNEEALATLTSGRADYLIIGLVRNPSEKFRFVEENRGYSASLTQPIRMVYAVFTDRGLKRLSRAERFLIGRKLRERYLAGRRMCEAPFQLFRMEGALSREQLAEVKGLLEGAPETKITKKVQAGWLTRYLFRKEDGVADILPNLTEPRNSNGQSGADAAGDDFFLNGGDVGGQDDIGLVSYYMDSEFFDMKPADKKAWLAHYVSVPGKRERAALLRDLQYRTLTEARVLPVALMGYSSVVRAPWKFDSPTMIAGDHFWRLRRS